MQTIKIITESSTKWHIGTTVNDSFYNYTTGPILYMEADIISSVELYFLGKDYKTDGDKYCKLLSIEFNQLILPEIFQLATFHTDNPNYPTVEHCDYINMNGVWKLSIDKDTIKNILHDKVT